MNRTHFRNSLVAGVLVALTLVIAACGSSTSAGGNAGSKKYNITYVQGVTGNAFFTSLTCGAQQEAQKLGNVNFTFAGGQSYSPEAQTPVLNAAIAKQPDAIIISPMVGQAMVAPLTQAKSNNIKLVFADTSSGDGSLAASFIASDNVAGGKLAADSMGKLLNGTGTVMVEGSTPGISTTDQRTQGFTDEMKASYPNIKLLTTQYSQSTPATATSQISAVLAAHPDLTGIFAVSTQEVEGAATALTGAGKQGKVDLIGFDTSDPIIADVQQGVVQGLVVQEPLQMGIDAMDQAVNALQGKATTPTIRTPFVFLTKENMSDPSISQFIYKTAC